MTKNSLRVQAWRKRAKQRLVNISGGKCCICGYNKCAAALEYHHLDPTEKDFSVTGAKTTKRLDLLISEVRKCVLLCANCHREVHHGDIDPTMLPALQFVDEALVLQYLSETEEAKTIGLFKKK